MSAIIKDYMPSFVYTWESFATLIRSIVVQTWRTIPSTTTSNNEHPRISNVILNADLDAALKLKLRVLLESIALNSITPSTEEPPAPGTPSRFGPCDDPDVLLCLWRAATRILKQDLSESSQLSELFSRLLESAEEVASSDGEYLKDADDLQALKRHVEDLQSSCTCRVVVDIYPQDRWTYFQVVCLPCGFNFDAKIR